MKLMHAACIPREHTGEIHSKAQDVKILLKYIYKSDKVNIFTEFKIYDSKINQSIFCTTIPKYNKIPQKIISCYLIINISDDYSWH